MFLLIPEGLRFGSLAAIILSYLLAIAFALSVIQIVIGVTEYFLASQSKEKVSRRAIAKKLLHRGILCIVMFFSISLIINIALSYTDGIKIQPLGCGAIKDCN